MFETQLMIQQGISKLSELSLNNKAPKKGWEEAQGLAHAHFCSAQSSKGLGILIFLTLRW